MGRFNFLESTSQLLPVRSCLLLQLCDLTEGYKTLFEAAKSSTDKGDPVSHVRQTFTHIKGNKLTHILNYNQNNTNNLLPT